MESMRSSSSSPDNPAHALAAQSQAVEQQLKEQLEKKQQLENEDQEHLSRVKNLGETARKNLVKLASHQEEDKPVDHEQKLDDSRQNLVDPKQKPVDPRQKLANPKLVPVNHEEDKPVDPQRKLLRLQEANLASERLLAKKAAELEAKKEFLIQNL